VIQSVGSDESHAQVDVCGVGFREFRAPLRAVDASSAIERVAG
jgi:hypothetical protein